MTGPRLDEGWVLLSPADLPYVARALGLLQESLRRDGLTMPAKVAAVADRVSSARTFASETAKARDTDPLPPSQLWTEPERIGTADASRMLSCTPQWVRHLCDAGEFPTARLVSGRWSVALDDVETYASTRTGAA